MEKKLLDLSTNIDQGSIATFAEVSKVADKLGVPFVVVGAMARDLILHHVYGVPISRATMDIDFGVQVSTWENYNQLKVALCEEGFSEDRQTQRLQDPRGKNVDLVPFGSLQDGDADIDFPPKGDFKMSVLGFQEAFDHSIKVIVQREPHVDVSVVSPQGLALLKIIAWDDRAKENRNRDAEDLAYLFEAYERVGDIRKKIYDEENLMESVDWDLPQASAYLLGKDTAAIAKSKTQSKVIEILNQSLDKESTGDLVIEMSDRIQSKFETNFNLLTAFSNGFKSGKMG